MVTMARSDVALEDMYANLVIVDEEEMGDHCANGGGGRIKIKVHVSGEVFDGENH